jgi:aspartate/tyrosine/aromatic aminotransferase
MAPICYPLCFLEAAVSYFSHIDEAPVDPIFGLNAAFLADTRPNKVNLGIGVYRGADQRPAVPEVIRRAEARLVEESLPKSYLPIDGDPEFVKLVAQLVFGGQSLHLDRIYGAQAVGGTSALRLAGDFLKQQLDIRSVYLSDPTWSNHFGIFTAAGLKTESYPYYDRASKRLIFDQFLSAVGAMPEKSAIVLHACCHNPTGLDPSLDQWGELAELLDKRQIVPVFDLAYQGFGEGLDEDAAAIRLFADRGMEFFVASSFSKNMGLYGERVAALFAVVKEPRGCKAVGSQICQLIRRNYSNPPCHGVRLAVRVLRDQEQAFLWRKELAAMRARIHEMRRTFIAGLTMQAKRHDFSFMEGQNGLFSFTGLNKEQVDRLKQEYAIYMPSSGRINVTGLTTVNMDYVVAATASVLD